MGSLGVETGRRWENRESKIRLAQGFIECNGDVGPITLEHAAQSRSRLFQVVGLEGIPECGRPSARRSTGGERSTGSKNRATSRRSRARFQRLGARSEASP